MTRRESMLELKNILLEISFVEKTRIFLVVGVLLSAFTLTAQSEELIDNVGSFYGHILIISLDADTINYVLETPNSSTGVREECTLAIHQSTSISDELMFIKDTGRMTKILLKQPFVQEISFNNNYNYLYLRIHHGVIEKQILSNEAREFW